MEDNEKDPDKTLPNAHLHKLAGIGHDSRRKQNWSCHLDEPFTERHIFQYWLIGKTSDLLKQGTANEKGLIPVDDATASAAKIVEKRNDFEPPVAAGELMHETARLNRRIRLHLI